MPKNMYKGGSSKGGTQYSAGVKSGLSDTGGMAGYTPEQCGMGTVGSDQKPQATPKDKAGKFRFR